MPPRSNPLASAFLSMLGRPSYRWLPNPGPQTTFMQSEAFEVLYGGQVGGGKSEALLYKALEGVSNKDYTGILFRRSFPDLEKSLISRSKIAYKAAYPDARYNESKHVWTFPSGAQIYFSHLEHDKSVEDHQSAEYSFIGFDELTHFTRWQYTYMLTRLRSSKGLRPIVRAATNPGSDGHQWVLERWAPWLDPTSLLKARPGEVLKYRSSGDGEAWDPDGSKSRAFIPARRTDTPQLPADYAEQFGALDPVTRAQLLDGNWLIKPAAGIYFKRAYFPFVEAYAVPKDTRWVRSWDLASTEPTKDKPDPDWTVGVKIGYSATSLLWYVAHAVRTRGGPAHVRATVKSTAEMDGCGVAITLPQDPGQAGKDQAASYVQMLQGFAVTAKRVSGDKLTRAKPLIAQAQPQSTGGHQGRICIVKGDWPIDAYVQCLEAFDGLEKCHDDDVDATADGFNALADKREAPRGMGQRSVGIL